MANGMAGPQLMQQLPNVGQVLGQLATSPPVGPIPVTPYAPANVGPLAMPGAGLAGPQTTAPPWTGGPAKKQQLMNPAGSVGGLMQPDGRTVGRGDHMIGAPISPTPSPYMTNLIHQLMQGQPIPGMGG